MSYQRKTPSKLGRAVQKYGVSAFVIGSFAAYALHERGSSSPSTTTAALATPSSVVQQAAIAPTTSVPTQALPSVSVLSVTPTAIAFPTLVAPTATLVAPTATLVAPTATLVAPTVAHGQLHDGTFTGSVADAYYGLVQVAATIKSGRIVDVQFVDYPHDRRTSARINSIAMPALMTEAIQAQSARVDVISGATLTSEAFAQSLQSALDTARA